MDVASGFEITQARRCTHLTTLIRVPDRPPHTPVLIPDRNNISTKDDVNEFPLTVDGHQHNTLPGGSIEL
jgi:hypothetical protein